MGNYVTKRFFRFVKMFETQRNSDLLCTVLYLARKKNTKLSTMNQRLSVNIQIVLINLVQTNQ